MRLLRVSTLDSSRGRGVRLNLKNPVGFIENRLAKGNIVKQVAPLILSLGIAALTLSSVLAASSTDLGVVRSYLLSQVSVQKTATARLNSAASSYYDDAKAAGFDYSKLTMPAVRKNPARASSRVYGRQPNL